MAFATRSSVSTASVASTRLPVRMAVPSRPAVTCQAHKTEFAMAAAAAAILAAQPAQALEVYSQANEATIQAVKPAFTVAQAPAYESIAAAPLNEAASTGAAPPVAPIGPAIGPAAGGLAAVVAGFVAFFSLNKFDSTPALTNKTKTEPKGRNTNVFVPLALGLSASALAMSAQAAAPSAGNTLPAPSQVPNPPDLGLPGPSKQERAPEPPSVKKEMPTPSQTAVTAAFTKEPRPAPVLKQ